MQTTRWKGGGKCRIKGGRAWGKVWESVIAPAVEQSLGVTGEPMTDGGQRELGRSRAEVLTPWRRGPQVLSPWLCRAGVKVLTWEHSSAQVISTKVSVPPARSGGRGSRQSLPSSGARQASQDLPKGWRVGVGMQSGVTCAWGGRSSGSRSST